MKSPPELWAEISDVEALARRLGAFGEIRITRVEPETTVAWEGDTARGTVELEASGWGTKVTLTAEVVEPPAPEPVAAEPEPEPVAAQPEPEPEAAPVVEVLIDPAPARRRFWARVFRRRAKEAPAPHVVAEPEPGPPAVEEPAAVEEPPKAPVPPADPQAVLVGALDSLGSDHHRPFSRG